MKPSLKFPLTILKGVGPKTKASLEKLKIYHVQDLLLHLPFRYEDKTKISFIGQLKPDDHALIEGHIIHLDYSNKTLHCILRDDSATIRLRFFHASKFILQQFEKFGLAQKTFRCFGKVRLNFLGQKEMMHPEYYWVNKENMLLSSHLTPIYSTIQTLPQGVLRKLVKEGLAMLANIAEESLEFLPQSLLPDDFKMTLQQALACIHFPAPEALEQLNTFSHPAQKRLAFEELLTHHLTLCKLKLEAHTKSSVLLSANTHWVPTLQASLPFALTNAQKKVLHEIDADLMQSRPMLRLLQGDVGSGKTLIACITMLKIVEQGYQAVLLAPTEILAEQHLETFNRFLKPFPIKIAGLLGHTPAPAREKILSELKQGAIKILVGTHAIFQEKVQFSNLALIVIDELHRFGVEQRFLMKEKAEPTLTPHQLIMTATPIPRTLAMTLYSHLDVSVLDELPKERQPIQTVVINQNRRDVVMQKIEIHCKQGKQAFWVCPLIQHTENMHAQSVLEIYAQLKEALPDIQMGLLHGQLKSEEKKRVMSAFTQGKIQLLVATSVVEVGVDIPNASLMIIENAERLGLAQLHQLRGRVGRGSAKSYCVLLYHGPLSSIAKKRLAVLRETQDGFKISQTDLLLRGPGEILGIKQSGLLNLKVADLVRDHQLFPGIKKVSEQIMQNDVTCIESLMARWVEGFEVYADI